MTKFTKIGQYVAILSIISMTVLYIDKRSKYYQISSETGFLEIIENTSIVTTPVAEINEIPPDRNKIIIAAVICSANGLTGPREEAAVMMKSVIISTILYETLSDIEFHLFLEHQEDQEFFRNKLKEFGEPFIHTQFSLLFHSTADVIPEKTETNLNNKDKRFRCMYVRNFFPSFLEEIDAILYLDTDMIITGDINELWSHFDQMDENQLIGVAPDFDDRNPKKSIFFGDIPVPPPKGLNSGLQLMNLTKMRQFHWETKLLKYYIDFKKRKHVQMNDQKLINILLYFDSERLYRLPCQFNFWATSCHEGLYCDGAIQDPKGIQVIHGAASSFNKGAAFREIFMRYKNFKLGNETTIEMIKEDLMKPIQEQYKMPTNGHKRNYWRRRSHNKCDGNLDKLLFKNHFNTDLGTSTGIPANYTDIEDLSQINSL